MSAEMTVEKERIVTRRYLADLPREWEEYLWGKYDLTFSTLDTYQEQRCYDWLAFQEVLRDPEYVKFVTCDGDSPRGLGILINNLEKAKAAYIKVDYLKKRYPKAIAEGRFYYLMGIFVDPEFQTLGYVRSLLAEMLLFIHEGNRVAGFDFCEKNEFLAQLLCDVSREDSMNIPIKTRRMDAQVYYVLEMVEQLSGDELAEELLVETKASYAQPSES